MSKKRLFILSDDPEIVTAIGAVCRDHYESFSAEWSQISRESDEALQDRVTSVAPNALVFVPPLWEEQAMGGKDNQGDEMLRFLENLYRVCRLAVPEIMRHHGGRIAAVMWRDLYGGGGSGTAQSSTTMAAVAAFVRTLAMEVARSGCTANGIVTIPPDTAHSQRLVASRLERERAYAFIDVAVRAEDIAHAVGFLVSARAQIITGALMDVDGGRSLGQQHM